AKGDLMASRPLVPSRRDSSANELRAAFAVDVQYYLSLDPLQLPSRYLYDALGSSLFEAICHLPWYPIARAEMRLLAAHRDGVAAATSPMGRIVELGGGNGEKLATLIGSSIGSSAPLEVHLIDVSSAALAGSMRALTALDRVSVVAHQVTYETGLSIVRE